MTAYRLTAFLVGSSGRFDPSRRFSLFTHTNQNTIMPYILDRHAKALQAANDSHVPARTGDPGFTWEDYQKERREQQARIYWGIMMTYTPHEIEQG